jgi:predicted PurR-regulated permease PerM
MIDEEMLAVKVVLPILLYIFGIILLIALIILVIRLIQVVNKVDKIADNVEDKVNSLNGIFKVIDKASDGVALISDQIINSIMKIIGRFLKKKANKEDEIDE